MLLNSVSTRRGKVGTLEFDTSLDFYCQMKVSDIEIESLIICFGQKGSFFLVPFLVSTKTNYLCLKHFIEFSKTIDI